MAHTPLVRCKRPRGRPQLYANNAEKQRAYRQREAEHRRKRKPKAYYLALTTEWATPQAFFDGLQAEFGFTLDVCAQPDNAKCPRYFSPDVDGLAQPWEGVCWCNPPYGKTLAQWIAKAHRSAQHGATVVCLVPAHTDTRWWHQYCAPPAEIRFIAGRLTFGGATHTAPFPSALIIFRPSDPGAGDAWCPEPGTPACTH